MPELRHVKPALVASLIAEPSYFIGALMMRSLDTRHVIRVMPTYDAWIKRSLPKEAGKHLLYRTVDGAKTSGDAASRVAQAYGLPPQRIFPITQSIDVDHYAAAQAVSSSERGEERQNRNLHGCVFIYVGRLWSGKGLDTLFDAYEALLEDESNVSLLIVGDGVEEDIFRARARDLPHVHFEGFVQPRDLPSLYALGDVFVFPTLGDPHGLVVEEAMAAGLPVISSTAAGDIEKRIVDGERGFLFQPGNSSILAKRMQRLSRDVELRQRFTEAGRMYAAGRSHERYAEDFECMVEKLLYLPRRRSPLPGMASLAGHMMTKIVAQRDVAPLVTEAPPARTRDR